MRLFSTVDTVNYNSHQISVIVNCPTGVYLVLPYIFFLLVPNSHMYVHTYIHAIHTSCLIAVLDVVVITWQAHLFPMQLREYVCVKKSSE